MQPPRHGDTCVAIRDVLDRVGDKWTALVIASLGPGTQRFTHLLRGIDGISQRMLTVTLRNLERDGLITRQIYAEIPPRVEYTLTNLGQSLLFHISGLVRWSTEHAEHLYVARAAFDQTLGAASAADSKAELAHAGEDRVARGRAGIDPPRLTGAATGSRGAGPRSSIAKLPIKVIARTLLTDER